MFSIRIQDEKAVSVQCPLWVGDANQFKNAAAITAEAAGKQGKFWKCII